MKRRATTIAAAAAAAVWLIWYTLPSQTPDWTAAETASIASLALANLAPPADDPSNAVADDPRAAALGHALFFDARFSANGHISCATCHQPIRNFTDGLQKGVALAVSRRNTPSITGAAYSPWLYWDGRKDSLWAQSLAPLEDPGEHGGNRMHIVRTAASDAAYRSSYQDLFGALPDLSDRERFPDAAAPGPDSTLNAAWQGMNEVDRAAVNRVFANLGKAIAAFERKILPGTSRFDAYAAALLAGDDAAQAAAMNADEAQGLRLFIGKARCIECHNGPLLTNNEFHNTGVLSFPGDLPDRGRADGLRLVRADPFNCLGDFNDAASPYCGELDFAREGPELIGAVRTPSLRNLENTAPYMHRGQIATLEAVIDHYNRAPLAMIGHNEAKPLSLSRRERRQLLAFLQTLFAPPAADDKWLQPPNTR